MTDKENAIESSNQEQSKKTQRYYKTMKNSFSIAGHNGAAM